MPALASPPDGRGSAVSISRLEGQYAAVAVNPAGLVPPAVTVGQGLEVNASVALNGVAQRHIFVTIHNDQVSIVVLEDRY